MSSRQADQFAELFAERYELMQHLGKLFAESFAVYTVAVLDRLDGGESKHCNGTTSQSTLSTQEQELLEKAPEWVRSGFAQQKASDVENADVADIRANVARNKLVLALRERGMTQAELARALGKSPTVVSRILKAPNRSRVKTLQEIADALDVDLSDIL